MVLCLMWLINVSGRGGGGGGGGVPAILDIIYLFLWHESEAQGLSAHSNKKVGCALTFTGITFLCIWIS